MKRILLLLTVLLLLLSGSIKPTAAQAPAIIPTGWDFAFTERGYFWDFSSTDHFAYDRTKEWFVNGGSVQNGWFTGTIRTDRGGENRVHLQGLTIPNTIPTQNEGGFYPIDTGYYRYLTYRVCIDVPSSQGVDGLIHWYTDGSFSSSTVGAVRKYMTGGCGIYTVDLLTATRVEGPVAWGTVPVQGISLKIYPGSGIRVHYDFARLSPNKSVGLVVLNWTPRSGFETLYFDEDPTGSRRTRIKDNVDLSTGTFTWTEPPNMAPGLYHLFADATKIGEFLVNSPADASLNNLTFTSGPDYASVVAGNPWDFNSDADITKTYNMTNISFSNGILTANNTNGDPIILMNVPQPIDTSKYYYATYTMRDLGPKNVGAGSVTRLFYKPLGSSQWNYATSEDIVIYEGWQTVSVDMREILLDPSSPRIYWTGLMDSFRIDPLEFPTVRTFQIDDIKLTGNERAQSGSLFSIFYSANDVNGHPLQTNFYFGNTKTGATIPITCLGSIIAPPPSADNLTYLPLIVNGRFMANSSSCVWDLSGVAPGTYYVKMVVNDGIDTTVRISETPLEVY